VLATWYGFRGGITDWISLRSSTRYSLATRRRHCERLDAWPASALGSWSSRGHLPNKCRPSRIMSPSTLCCRHFRKKINPFAQPEELETLARQSGLQPQRVFDVDWTWEYPDRETLLRGWLSARLSTLAIESAGEQAVREKLAQTAEPFRVAAGCYRIENNVGALLPLHSPARR
jgi:hypothetical protein